MPDDAMPIRNVLLDGARRWGIDFPVETAQVFGHWRELVGDQVAARCQPASLGKGVLRVVAATPAWAGELRYLAPEVIRRVNEGVGAGVVKELKVTVKPAEGSGRAKREVNGTGSAAGTGLEALVGPAPAARPPSAAEREEADKVAAGIPDERLAEAMKHAFLAAKTRRNAPGKLR